MKYHSSEEARSRMRGAIFFVRSYAWEGRGGQRAHIEYIYTTHTVIAAEEKNKARFDFEPADRRSMLH